MYRVVACITQEHNLWLLLLPVIVCVSGSFITVLQTMRLSGSTGQRRALQLGLSSIIGGATIWSTHFLAMLAFEPGFEHAYEPVLTILSLVVAIVGLLIANAVFTLSALGSKDLIAGTIFGLTVSAMHYSGMSAYLLPGDIVWEADRQVVSVALGVVLGALAYRQIHRPVTRHRWLAGTALMVSAICAMHFTGMTAFTIELNSAHEVPPEVISDAALSAIIMAVTLVILLIGFASFSIESQLKRETRGKLQYAALHDSLTSLPNRMGLSRAMEEFATRLNQDENEKVAVLTIDLNLFKEVNDLYGHAAGDIVLSTLASRFSVGLAEDEFIARAGGDEFIALKRGFRRVDQVLAFAERLHAIIVEPIEISNISTTVGAAIGVATSIDDGRDMDELLHSSDLAMYRAKSEPECHICLFNADVDQQSHERNVLINDLRQALSKSEFELAYQLQNSVSSREATGFEVLLRWNHPTQGRIPPSTFIPVAEETGLIREIGLWVLRAACKEAAEWKSPFDIAVNVAPQQLVQPSFVEHVADILMETRLNPRRLELEVTEASIIDDQAAALKAMHKLKSLGVRIAMDDFGTGYSSLATLQAFPFDKIKIDRSFVQDVHKNEQRAAIVRSTLILGDALNIPVLAEGVEMEDELRFLHAENCNAAQGFLFGKPLSHDEMRQFVNKTEDREAS